MQTHTHAAIWDKAAGAYVPHIPGCPECENIACNPSGNNYTVVDSNDDVATMVCDETGELHFAYRPGYTPSLQERAAFESRQKARFGKATT
jgi:hypothetical protein